MVNQQQLLFILTSELMQKSVCLYSCHLLLLQNVTVPLLNHPVGEPGSGILFGTAFAAGTAPKVGV